MTKERCCQKCIDTLESENSSEWVRTLDLIGNSLDKDWCRICRRMMRPNIPVTDLYPEAEDDEFYIDGAG